MKVPFHKMDLQPDLLDMINIEKILRSGKVVNGVYTRRLEDKFKELTGVSHAIACANCTSGLVLALKATNLVGKTIALPAFTWPSTLYALQCNNCQPVFCDIDYGTWLLSPLNTSKKIDAVLAVDTFGNQVNVITDLPVIYDAAHGFGLKKLGQRGLVEVISLAMTKAVTAMQGGMILTNSAEIAHRLREDVRTFAKITEINAYIGLKSIDDFATEVVRRAQVLKLYNRLLTVSYKSQWVPFSTNFSVFAILLETQSKRDRVIKKLDQEGIETKVYYKPLVRGLKNTDEIYSRILALPIHIDAELEIPRICDIINST